jgi:uncharacterized coiled-coil protein SlyX
MQTRDPQNGSLEERLEKIESHMAFLERLVDQLNETVIEQAKEVHRLRGQQCKVAASLEELELDRIRSTNSKPPHYQ